MNGVETTDGLELNQLVSFYIQQNSAVNQLWSMYALTAFAAAVFASEVDAKQLADWLLLLAGFLGFLFFTIGHYHMVVNGAIRLNLAAVDIARIRANRASAEPPTLVDHLADGYSVRSTRIVHRLIDSCVVLAFLAMAVRGLLG